MNKVLKRNGQCGRTCRARLRDSDGRVGVATLSRKQAALLKKLAKEGAPPRVLVDSRGRITKIQKGDARSTEYGRQRFAIPVDPLNFTPHISAEWKELLELWTDKRRKKRSLRLLLYGFEGTGKDTLANLTIQKIVERDGHENVVILGLPEEEGDRYVNHLQTKANQLVDTILASKQEGKTVIVYFPEIASIFGSGDYSADWQTQFKAFMRNILDGAKGFPADLVLAHTNTLSGLGGPTLSRFRRIRIAMNPESARGILDSHWPHELLNGDSSQHVLDRLSQEDIAEARLASDNRVTWRAQDLSGFNGRFLADLCFDIEERLTHHRRDDPDFVPDHAFIDRILRTHLEGIVDPLIEAAGTRQIRELILQPVDLRDPPVAVESSLAWCDDSQYLVS